MNRFKDFTEEQQAALTMALSSYLVDSPTYQNDALSSYWFEVLFMLRELDYEYYDDVLQNMLYEPDDEAGIRYPRKHYLKLQVWREPTDEDSI